MHEIILLTFQLVEAQQSSCNVKQGAFTKVIRTLARLFLASLLVAALGLHSGDSVASGGGETSTAPCSSQHSDMGTGSQEHKRHAISHDACFIHLDCPLSLAQPSGGNSVAAIEPQVKPLKMFDEIAYSVILWWDTPPPKS